MRLTLAIISLLITIQYCEAFDWQSENWWGYRDRNLEACQLKTKDLLGVIILVIQKDRNGKYFIGIDNPAGNKEYRDSDIIGAISVDDSNIIVLDGKIQNNFILFEDKNNDKLESLVNGGTYVKISALGNSATISLKGSSEADSWLNRCVEDMRTDRSLDNEAKLYSYFSHLDNPASSSVKISPCTGSEVDECISHMLSCERTSGSDPGFTIMNGDIEKIVPILIDGTNGNVNIELILKNKSLSLGVTSIEVYPDLLNETWGLTIGLGSTKDFYDALTEKNSEGASLIVAGKRFPLAPQKGDGKKLVAWKNACMALEGQSVAEPASSTPLAKPECKFNSRLYRASLYKDPDPDSYQELQFTDGAAEGTVALTEYRQGQAVWAAYGHFACSNGASICRVNFPTMLGQPVELAYEVADGTDNSPETVVIPALRQEVYQTEQYAEAQGKAYGGIVAEFQGRFKPKVDELILPYNVYQYAGCK